MADQSLFTSQTPTVTDASDGTPGITTATSLQFSVPGYIYAVRFYATATVGGTYTGAVWQVTGSDTGTPAGTLLTSKTLGATPTGGTWNNIVLDTPLAVTATTLYRVGLFSGAGRYVATNNFFLSPVVNGSITAEANNASVSPVGTIKQGVFAINATLTYPSNTGVAASYFVDVVFNTDPPPGGAVTPTALAVPVTLGQPTVRQQLTLPGLAVPVSLGQPGVAGAAYVPPVSLGSWGKLQGVITEARQIAREERATRPVACPSDGEPLQQNSKGVWFCPYDNWRPGV